MIPVYSGTAIAAIAFPSFDAFLILIRSCYEALVLFTFIQLMLAYLSIDAPSQGDGARGAIWVALDISRDPQVFHMFPLCFLAPWEMGPIFLRRLLLGVFQYTAMMPVIAALTAMSKIAGIYGDGDSMDQRAAYPWLTMIQNTSQCYALYCMVLFYKAASSKLQGIRPLLKFLCIKLVSVRSVCGLDGLNLIKGLYVQVVFFLWWQNLIIAALVYMDCIQGFDLGGGTKASSDESASLLANFIVCIEMLIMAEGAWHVLWTKSSVICLPACFTLLLLPNIELLIMAEVA